MTFMFVRSGLWEGRAVSFMLGVKNMLVCILYRTVSYVTLYSIIA